MMQTSGDVDAQCSEEDTMCDPEIEAGKAIYSFH